MKLFLDNIAGKVERTKESLLKKYERFLCSFLPFRKLVLALHLQLNRIQYDPLNPKNRTTENPDGIRTEEESSLALKIEHDKTLIDKVESYFKLRPVSTSLLAFFVISAAATSSRGQPIKIAIAVAIIFAILPLLTSRQKDFEENID